jgi:hypothetical protein
MAYTSRIERGVELTTEQLDNNFLCHYPLGSIYINALKHQSPGVLIGYGKWEKFAQGYVLMSADSPSLSQLGDRPDDPKTGNSPDYFSPGVTGGSPSVSISSWIQHQHEWQDISWNGKNYDGRFRMQGSTLFRNDGSHGGSYTGNYYRKGGSFTSTNIGSGHRHNNLQPYITVNIWKRVK